MSHPILVFRIFWIAFIAWNWPLGVGCIVGRRLPDGLANVMFATFRVNLGVICGLLHTFGGDWCVRGDGLIEWGKTAVLMTPLLWLGQSLLYAILTL